MGSSTPFSLGFTLKELSAYTTNNQWEPAFYDRQLSENKGTPIYKKLKVDSFAIYLHVGDWFLLSEEKKDK